MTIKIKAQGALPAALVSAQGLGVSSAIAPGLPADQTSGELLTRSHRPDLGRTPRQTLPQTRPSHRPNLPIDQTSEELHARPSHRPNLGRTPHKISQTRPRENSSQDLTDQTSGELHARPSRRPDLGRTPHKTHLQTQSLENWKGTRPASFPAWLPGGGVQRDACT